MWGSPVNSPRISKVAFPPSSTFIVLSSDTGGLKPMKSASHTAQVPELTVVLMLKGAARGTIELSSTPLAYTDRFSVAPKISEFRRLVPLKKVSVPRSILGVSSGKLEKELPKNTALLNPGAVGSAPQLRALPTRGVAVAGSTFTIL